MSCLLKVEILNDTMQKQDYREIANDLQMR